MSTLSFHQENSAIAEGLVPLRVPGLDFTDLEVLCFCSRSSELVTEVNYAASTCWISRRRRIPARVSTTAIWIGAVTAACMTLVVRSPVKLEP